MVKKPVKILFLHTPMTFGGAEIFIAKLVLNLKHLGVEPILMCRSAKLFGLATARAVTKIPFIIPAIKKTLNPLRWVVSLVIIVFSAFSVGRVIRKYSVDLIAVHSWDSFMCSLLAAKMFKIPIVYHSHGALKPHFFTRALCRLIIAPHVILVIAVSDMIRDYYVTQLGFDARKIQRIYNGVDLTTIESGRARETRRDIVVGTVTRIEPEKGLHVFIEAAQIILHQIGRFKFWIVGDVTSSAHRSYLRELQKRIADRGLESEIKFWGWRDDITEILAQMDIFVYTTIEREGLPLAILEAMVLAKPVAASAVGGIQEVITNNQTGILLPPGNVTAVVDAILKLAGDRAFRDEIGNAGREKVIKDFSYDRFLNEIKDAYLAVLKP